MTSGRLGLIALAIVACGDNSDQCGPGTVNVDNVCVPTAVCGAGTITDMMTGQCVPDPSLCGVGTIFDPASNTCVVDPNSCQGGTILVDGTCQDPTAGLTIDVEEAPEPNGYGVIESSLAPAGILPPLKPVGGTGLVIHGHFAPFQDADHDGNVDPDADTYVLVTTGPAYVRVMVDGVGGAIGGFTITGLVQAGYPSWTRTSLSRASDFSRRTMFLPGAGSYKLTIADSRTLLDAHAAPDGEYFVTIDQLAVPTPDAIAIAANHGSVSDAIEPDETKFYSFAPGTGIQLATLTMPSDFASGGVALVRGNSFVGFGVASNHVANCLGAGFTADATVVVEPEVAYTGQALPFTLDIATSDATPLSTTGGSVAVTERATGAADPTGLLSATQFTFDATAANQTFRIDLDWTRPVVGAAFDERVGVAPLAFTDPLSAGAATWTGYHGTIRVPHAGRYTFVMFDRSGTPNVTQLGATSSLSTMTPAAVGAGTAADIPLDATLHRAAIVYTKGGGAWHAFDAIGTNTAGHTLTIYPDTYGRLDTLATSAGPVAGLALQSHTYPEAGGAFGRVILADSGPTYFMMLAAASGAADQSVHVAFGARSIVDLGTAAPGTPAVATGITIDTTNAPHYVLVRTAIGNTANITVHPQAPLILDTRFHRVAADESAAGAVIDTSSNGDDTEQVVQAAPGWTALIVDAVTPPTGATAFDVTVSATAP